MGNKDYICSNCGKAGHKESSHCTWCNGLHNLCVDKLIRILKENKLENKCYLDNQKHSKNCVCPTI